MTSFATCAHVGCTVRIPYDPHGYFRPRYCPEHEAHVIKKFGIKVKASGYYIGWDSLYIKIPHTTIPPAVKSIHILRCPCCKSRVESTEWTKQCECGTTMRYHKDVNRV